MINYKKSFEHDNFSVCLAYVSIHAVNTTLGLEEKSKGE